MVEQVQFNANSSNPSPVISRGVLWYPVGSNCRIETSPSEKEKAVTEEEKVACPGAGFDTLDEVRLRDYRRTFAGL